MEWRRGDHTVSDDRDRLQIEVIHGFLTNSYWVRGISEERMRRVIQNSNLCFGLYEGEAQIGFARIVTDFTRFAWLSDVFVLPEKQGHGLGTWLVQCVREHPDMREVDFWLLKTRDAHDLYSKFGFAAPPDPERYMAYRKPSDA